MKTPLSMCATCAAALLLVYGTPWAQTPASDGPAGSDRAAATAQSGQLAAEDAQFVEKAAQSGHTEVVASKSAQQRSKNADVQAFADQMVKDHTAAGQELSAIAKSKGATPPEEPSEKQKAMLDALNEKQGDEFDREYAKQIGVAAHEEAVKLFKQASEQLKDADLKAYAARTLPKLQEHLKMAEKLAEKTTK